MNSILHLDKEGVLELAKALQTIGTAVVHQDQALRIDVAALKELVAEAMLFQDAQDTIWLDEAKSLLQIMDKRRIDQENARFGNRYGGKMRPSNSIPQTEADPRFDSFVEAMKSSSPTDVVKAEGALNAVEAGFGEEMTEEQLAAHFKVSVSETTRTDRLKKPLNKMTLEEIKDLEAEQDNSNDIYKISARIKNLARGDAGKSLGPQQEALCNTFCHVVKAYYDFADLIADKELKAKLQKLTRMQESVPANLIAAAVASVKAPR